MGEILLNTKKVNSKILIIVFSVFAILSLSFSQLIFSAESLIDSIDYLNARHLVYMITDFSGALALVLSCALLVLYVVFLYKKFSAKIILAAIFVLLSLPFLGSIIVTIANIVFSGAFEVQELLQELLYDFAFNFLPYMFLWVAAVFALFGVKNKVVYIFALVLSAFPYIYYFMSWVQDTTYVWSEIIDDIDEVFERLFDSWSYYFICPIWYVGVIVAVAAVIVFIASNGNLISKKKIEIKADEEVKDE